MPLLPPSFAIYARSGYGKTTGVIQALGPYCHHLCLERNAIAPAYSAVNTWWPKSPIPPHTQCLSTHDPVGEVLDVCRKVIVPAAANGLIRAVSLDTLTTLAEREMVRIHRMGVKDLYGAANKALLERILSIVHLLLEANLIVIAICHEREPSMIEGKITQGGPALPGKGTALLAAQFDFVLRQIIDLDDSGNRRRVYTVDPLDTLWITKDRYSLVRGTHPVSDLRGLIKSAIDLAKK